MNDKEKKQYQDCIEKLSNELQKISIQNELLNKENGILTGMCESKLIYFVNKLVKMDK